MINNDTIEKLVNEFLVWKLPASVCSDTCVTTREYPHQRIGTNLLTADEARQMFEYLFTKIFGEKNGMTIQEAILSQKDFYREKWLQQLKNDNSEIDTEEWAIQELDKYNAVTEETMDAELYGLMPEDILANDWRVDKSA